MYFLFICMLTEQPKGHLQNEYELKGTKLGNS
jgi:hypothetical protein